jgi:3-oxoacyl-[acyl-carrier-protein] synthase II
VAGEIRDFDPKDFITSRKAKMMGRFSQFAVAATKLALQDASLKITPDTASKTSIFYGTSVNGGGDVAAGALEGIWREGVSGINPWAALEYPSHATSSYVAIEFGITGPALSVSSNCCTGIDAIKEGFQSIRDGGSSIAIVGSSDAPIFPLAFGAFCALGALSKRNDAPQKASRPYDSLRDGIVMSEAVATLVLVLLYFARARLPHLYA